MEAPEIIAMNERLDQILRDGVDLDSGREAIHEQITFS